MDIDVPIPLLLSASECRFGFEEGREIPPPFYTRDQLSVFSCSIARPKLENGLGFPDNNTHVTGIMLSFSLLTLRNTPTTTVELQ